MKLTEPIVSVTICMSFPSLLGGQDAVIKICLEPPSRACELSVGDKEAWEVIEKLAEPKASAVVCIRS